MTPKEHFERLRKTLLGQKVSYRRLAANSLLIYINCELSDEQGFIIWLEPTWHFCGPQGVLVGSRQAQCDNAEDEEETLAHLGEILDVLVGKAVTELYIEPRTYDLRVSFQDQYYIQTFVNDPTNDDSWNIRDRTWNINLYGSPNGLYIMD